MNDVTLLGHVGRDPETRSTKDGLNVVNLSLATNEYGGKDKKKVTEWHRLVFFGKQAETVSKYVTKGTQIAVKGRMQTKTYKGKDGVEKSLTQVVCHNFEFVDAARQTTNPAPVIKPVEAPPKVEAPATDFETNNTQFLTDDDVPF